MRKLVIAVAVALLAGVVSAAYGSGHTTRADRGMAAVKAAHIPVDPQAAAILEQAPVGSCPNAPLQPKCGKAPKAIHMAPPSMDHVLTPPPAPGSQVPYVRSARAECDSWIAAPDRPPGSRTIYGWTSVGCTPNVDQTWMWSTLYEWTKHSPGCAKWCPMAISRVGRSAGGLRVARTASKRCKWYGGSWDKNARAWRTQGDSTIDFDDQIFVLEPHRKNTRARCVA